MCLDALLFLNVNLTLNFYVISVQNASRNDQGLYSMDDWAVVQLLLFWIKNQVTNTFKRMMILIKTEKQCNVSSTNMKKWTREQVMLGNIIIWLTKNNNHTNDLKLFGKTDNSMIFSANELSSTCANHYVVRVWWSHQKKKSFCPPHSSKWQCLRPFEASHDTINSIPLVVYTHKSWKVTTQQRLQSCLNISYNITSICFVHTSLREQCGARVVVRETR